MSRFILIVAVSFIALGLFPDNTSAAEGLVTCTGGNACNFCSFVSMVNNIVEWLVIVGTTLIVLIISYAGFTLITSGGNATALEKGKKMMTNSIIGIIIMLAGWTIVDTFLKVFTGGDLGVWNETDCGGIYAVEKPQDFKIKAKSHEGVDYSSVENFVGDHGYGSAVTRPGVIVGSGGNCPGASASQVVGIPNENGKFLLPSAANNFVTMRTAAAATGITLRLSSAWRSQATQEEIWSRHNCDVVGCSGTVARPCSKGGSGSNHNGGVAVDIKGSSRGSTIYTWLKANGGRYGFNNNLGPNDPVHWSPSGR